MGGLKSLNQPVRKLGGTAGLSETLGPVQRSVKTITNTDSPYTVESGDHTILCDCTGGAIQVDLPTAIGNTRELRLKKIDISANAVTIDAFGTETIERALTNTDLDVQGEAFTIQADESDYLIMGSF